MSRHSSPSLHFRAEQNSAHQGGDRLPEPTPSPKNSASPSGDLEISFGSSAPTNALELVAATTGPAAKKWTDSGEPIKLQCNDGEVVEVCRAIVALFCVLDGLCEGMEKNVPKSKGPIRLPNVSGRVLRKVIEWCTLYLANTTLAAWSPEFLNRENDSLLVLLLAANDLGIEDLYNEACAAIGSVIREADPRDVLKTFKVSNDLAAEQEQELIAQIEDIKSSHW